jgi:hypothetical protein
MQLFLHTRSHVSELALDADWLGETFAVHDAVRLGSRGVLLFIYTVALRNYLRCTLQRTRQSGWHAASAIAMCSCTLRFALWNLHLRSATFGEWKSIECFMSAALHKRAESRAKKGSLCVILNVSLHGTKCDSHLYFGCAAREHSACLWYFIYTADEAIFYSYCHSYFIALSLSLAGNIPPRVLYTRSHFSTQIALRLQRPAFKGRLIKY